MAADSRVHWLGLKLLDTLHLSVPERKELPTTGIPFSVLVAGVTSRLEMTGWFPERVSEVAELWTGARLEQRGSEVWVHERQEAGIMRVGPVRSKRVQSVEEGVRAFIYANGGTSIDGVLID